MPKCRFEGEQTVEGGEDPLIREIPVAETDYDDHIVHIHHNQASTMYREWMTTIGSSTQRKSRLPSHADHLDF